MTTKLYIGIVVGMSALCALCVLLVACLRLRALHSPDRPAKLSASAVWRPTPTESIRLFPHGDWIDCRQEGKWDRCILTDASGNLEYEGKFIPIPENAPMPEVRLLPTDSDTISPWMWSNHANRLVPMIHLENETVLVPAESVSDLRSYIERMQKFEANSTTLPLYLRYHPAASSMANQH